MNNPYSHESPFLAFDSSWQHFFNQHVNSSSENPKSNSSHQISGNSNASSQHTLIRGVSSEGCRTLDRRTERERRIRTEPAPRLDARGLFCEDFPPLDMSLTRNGFRPGTRHPYFQKNEHPLVTTSYRYGNPREFGAPLASITGTAGATTTLQGYRVGISSREKQNRPVPQRAGRIRNGANYSGGTEKKAGYLYTDAVPGACQAFQQRLIEIANLEGDTIRYERMRKVKKKAKQDK
ncbi:hypothetical protein HOLleu_22954 [Holothuria leucospilota]|uniref:Uncharacterized protein n=1 Tax=Holothuria leucospilota TaxID=206669 RepID=A0A9Q1H2K1_HOLLE|nr:hypothetical protein HOLleu_22954 [Holothuria leucospilota]